MLAAQRFPLRTTMGDPFHNTNQQQTRDNSNEGNYMSLFSSPSYVWNYPHSTTQQNRSVTLTPSSGNVVSILSPHIGHQSNRNLLMTNIPQNHYTFISDMINAHYQDSVYKIVLKHDLGTVSMAVLFYGINQAKLCHAQLTHLVENTIEFHLAEVKLCSSVTVSSTFDVELEKLRDTHLSVSLFGALSNHDVMNYKEILESFGELHTLAKLEHSEIKMVLMVEYMDTRDAVAAKDALQDRTEQGIVFSAYLTKLEVEQSNARNIQRPIDRLSSSFENHISSLLQVSTSSSRHTGDPQLVPQYSMFGNTDNQGWPPSSSSQIQHPRPLPTSSLTPPRSLVHHAKQQKQHTTQLAGAPLPFALKPKDPNASPIDWSFANAEIGSHYHRLQQQPGIPTPLQLSTHHQHRQRQNENNDLKHGFSLGLPTIIGHPMLASQKTALLTPTSNELEATIESNVHCYFGPASTPSSSSSSSLTIRDRRISPQPVGKIPSNPIKSAEARENYRFDVEKVINGMDNRTTFMIRNIPNKYTQAMLMKCIDATHKNTYDFLYLRMDFKNKCNVGYAFINFIDVKSVISFARRKQGQHWNQFNSDKKCELSYAKIQGKPNLIEKFRNSMVMEQEVSYRPKIFYSSGPRKGEEEEFPTPTSSSNAKK